VNNNVIVARLCRASAAIGRYHRNVVGIIIAIDARIKRADERGGGRIEMTV